MPTENPIIRAITMLQDYKGDLARRDFPDNDEGDHQQRVNENKRASVDAAIQGLRAAQSEPVANHSEHALHMVDRYRPLIRNAIGLLGMRRPVAPDVEKVIRALEAMLEGQMHLADAPSAEWLYVAELAAGQAEDAAGSTSVQAMLGAALKRLTFAARTSGGTAGPDAELIAACEQAEHAMSFVGIGQAYMAGVNSLSTAAQDVLAERNRQITAEGWTPEHDDQHGNGQMAVAAGYYALACGWPHERDIGIGHKPAYWPWHATWWKPAGQRRNLVKAGALILAEIERLDRAAALQPAGIDSEGGSHD